MSQSTAPAPGPVAEVSAGALPGALVEVGVQGTKKSALLIPQESDQTAGGAELNSIRRPILLKMQQAPLLPKASWKCGDHVCDCVLVSSRFLSTAEHLSACRIMSTSRQRV